MGEVDNIKEYQFKPGESGNPAGRPKGTSVTTILKKLLEQYLKGKNPLTGEDANLPTNELISLKLIAQALNGSERAIEMIQDRLEGKVKQVVGLEGNMYNKIEIVEKTNANAPNGSNPTPEKNPESSN